MSRSFGIALFFLIQLRAAASALGCEPIPSDPSAAEPTVEQIMAALPEAVLEGEIVQRDPLTGHQSRATKRALMRIDHAWKGEAGPIATLLFNEASDSCGQPPPPVGTHLRISVDPVSPNAFRYDALSPFELPSGPNMEQALHQYQRRTEELRMRAESGGRNERRAFAQYLLHNGETHHALWTYQALVRQDAQDIDDMAILAVLQARTDDENGARNTMQQLSLLAPRSEEWRGKLARVAFEATGSLSSEWKDYSGVENAVTCRRFDANFDGASFAGSRLRCDFTRVSFRGANFKGADLGSVGFDYTDNLTGAVYDCATIFRYDFNPFAHGMINVESTCTALHHQESE